MRVADLAELHGSGRVRLTTQQKIVVLDVPHERVERLVASLEEMDLRVRPGELRRAAMACTGKEFCKLAVVETKDRTDRLVRELERRLPDLAEPIRIHMNGCPNSCARFQLADIGLLGSLVPGPDGERVEGYQVHVGGHLGPGAAVARRVKGVRVRGDELDDYLEGLLRRFLATRAEDEPFHRWAARADPSWLEPQAAHVT
jgi:sulfite reductase (ferredoxin)